MQMFLSAAAVSTLAVTAMYYASGRSRELATPIGLDVSVPNNVLAVCACACACLSPQVPHHDYG